ncbi:MAG: capsular biosynthesis protein, partial [Cytophagaceae bacterium]
MTSPLFPNFVDQREMKLWSHFKHGVIHLWRFIERSRDSEYDPLFAGEMSGTYYAVPLQVHSDTQITRCSDFKSIEQFIKRVVISFEKFAPADTKLVFKVHPMDRGYKDYMDLIAGLDHKLGGGRILYVDRVHLPTLLSHSRGVVNINSSVGISGLVHHVPVLTLGTAVYNLADLSYQGGLDSFWRHAQKPKAARVRD